MKSWNLWVTIVAKFEPPPFVIAYDTREQAPLDFLGFAAMRKTLKAGDYSILGYETRVACERKSYGDLWGSMSTGRARFERCVRRLAELDRAAIVIECSLSQAAVQHPDIQRTNAASVIGGLISWSCQFAIPVYFCDTREQSARVIVRFLAAWLKHRAPLFDGESNGST